MSLEQNGHILLNATERKGPGMCNRYPARCENAAIRAKAAVFASVRIRDPPVHLLICCGRRLKLVATRPALLNHIAGRDRLRDPKL
jgi:hypothetical protein